MENHLFNSSRIMGTKFWSFSILKGINSNLQEWLPTLYEKSTTYLENIVIQDKGVFLYGNSSIC